MLWTNSEYMAAVSDDDMSKIGHPMMTLVSTSHLEVEANSSQISLTNDEYIQYMTINFDAKNSSSAKSNKAAEMSDTKVTPLKRKPRRPRRLKRTPGMMATHLLMAARMPVYFWMVRAGSNPGVEGSRGGLMTRPMATRKWWWPT